MNNQASIGLKVINFILVLVGISLVTFALSFMAPGDPALNALDQEGLLMPTEEQIQSMRNTLGLDLPWYTQYVTWLGKVMQGDLGSSYKSGIAVSEELLRRMPVTLTLAFWALVSAASGGIIIGVVGILSKNTFLNGAINTITNGFLATPNFVMSLILILVFSEILQLLPTSGMEGTGSLLLPTFVLSFTMMALVGRFLKEKLREELQKQYCIVAKARGLSEPKILFSYAFPNACVPVLALLGNYFGNILGGSVVVESVFALPGLGSLALEAIRFRDYPVLQGYVLLMGVVFILIYAIIDFVLLYYNPKLKIRRNTDE